MSKKLTHKEKGFVKDIVKGETGTQAALNNYDTESYGTAGVIAHENLKKPKIISALEEALPDELLAQVHKEGLFATKPNYSSTKDPVTGVAEKIDEEPDYAVRHKYLDTAYKLKGNYAPEKSININAQFNLENKEEVETIASKVLEQMRNDEIV